MFFTSIALLSAALSFNSNLAIQTGGFASYQTDDYGRITDSSSIDYIYSENSFFYPNNQNDGPHSADIGYFMQYTDNGNNITLNYLNFNFINYIADDRFEVNITQSSLTLNMFLRITFITDTTTDYINMDYMNSSNDEYSIGVPNDSSVYEVLINYYLYESRYLYDLVVDADNGYQNAIDVGYEHGVEVGKQEGVQDYINSQQYQDALDSKYEEGFNSGYNDGINTQTYTFSQLFGAIADTPIMIMYNLLGFDVFGVSALSIVMTMLTACIVLYLFKRIIL